MAHVLKWVTHGLPCVLLVSHWCRGGVTRLDTRSHHVTATKEEGRSICRTEQMSIHRPVYIEQSASILLQLAGRPEAASTAIAAQGYTCTDVMLV